jgi:hypothetical protein
MLTFRNFIYLTLLLFGLWGCSKDEQIVNTVPQQEVLTTLTLTFVENQNTSVSHAFTFRTADGVAFNRPPKLDTIDLKDSATYTLKVQVLDESKQVVVNQTDEITALSTEHQFFYYTFPNGLLQFVPSSFNKDTDGKVLGTQVDTVIAAQKGTGSLKVILRHLPLKDAAHVAKNDTTNDSGETDIAVMFPLKIQ